MLPKLEPPKVEPVEKRKFNFREEYDTNPTFKASVDEGRARAAAKTNTRNLTAALLSTEKGSKADKLY
jgi:hypothetical protein